MLCPSAPEVKMIVFIILTSYFSIVILFVADVDLTISLSYCHGIFSISIASFKIISVVVKRMDSEARL